MTNDTAFSRRRILRIAGVTASTAVLAGCADEGPAEEEEPADDTEPADETDDEEEAEDEEAEDETDDDEMDDDETDDDETDDDAAADVEEWEDVDEIVLDGYTPGWEGVEPEAIEGEENPTLVLFEGQEYDITWENMDGEPHNIEIWDEDEEVVDDYQTEIIEEEGETQTLTIDEVTDEMAQYVCEVHIGTMIGDIQVETENGEDENGNDE